MNKRRKHSSPAASQIVSALVVILLMIGLIVFAAGYDPNAKFSNSFFDDVSNAVQWR